ncbi:MAG: NAD-dependent epimerase [Nitrospirae bacterium GWC2_46_6]|nr:MAG: NAD-dependent epimerase [Nitrospirae bacterium GWC2_46_6]OGW24258.1 MAG: NAD-dependent epimerase [Nitrospirae bacterium GWB2_47_37]HAK89630.1 NAD-dependent epimerase [Nitrospiraceae bacterium]
MDKIYSFYKDRSVIITGGLGFIGSSLAIRLTEVGARVTIVDSLISQYGGNMFNVEPIKDSVKINIMDIRDRHGMNNLVRGQDIMFNLAAQASHIGSMEDPFADLAINVQGQLSVLEACRENNPDIKIIFTSTRQIYGRPQYLPVDEDHPLRPTDVNGINKIAGEQYHILYRNAYGIETVILRLTNTYGPRLLVKHNRQGFLGWFLRLLLEGKEITIFGDGCRLRDLNYVDDVVDALLLSGYKKEAAGQVMNLGNHESISLLEIVKTMIEVNKSGKYNFMPFPDGIKKIDIGDSYADFSKAKNILGWEPKTSFKDGLLKTMEYYRKYGKDYYWH